MSFDRLAPHYCWMERVTSGGKLQRCRTRFVAAAGDARNILILGEGDGRFAVELLRQGCTGRVTVVDASERMILRAARRIERSGAASGRVRWVRGDVLEGMPDGGPFDLVVTHFFLDCFRGDQLEQLIPAIAERTMPDARWLLADFQVPMGGWRRRRAQMMLALMYPFFRITVGLPARRLISPDAYLEAAGFKLRDRRTYEWGFLRSDCWVRDAVGSGGTRMNRIPARADGWVQERLPRRRTTRTGQGA